MANHQQHLQIAEELGDRGGVGIAYLGIGNAHLSLGNYREALENHQKRLQIAEELGDRGGVGRAYSGIGNAHSRLGNYREALQYHQKHLQIAEELGDRGGVAGAYGNIGNAHQALSNYREALENHQKDLQIAEELGERGGVGRAYANIGIAHSRLGNYREALQYHQQHLQIAEELGERGGVGRAYANIGSVHKALSNYREALENHQKALKIFEELGDRDGVGRAYGNIGIAHSRLGNYREALEHHQKALKIFEELGDRGGVGTAYGNIGNAHDSLGNYREALANHQKSLEIAEELGDRGGVGMAYGNIGNAHDSLGNYREALQYHQKDLQIAEELGDRGGVGSAYANIGNAHRHLGNYRKALEHHQKRLQIAEELGDRGGVGSAYGNIGNAHYSLGNYREALENHQKALKIFEELGDRGGVGRAYGNIGNAHYCLGNYREALQYHQKDLQIAEELGDRGGVGGALNNLGLLHSNIASEQLSSKEKEAAWLEAERCYRRSVQAFSEITEDLKDNPQAKISIFEEQSKAHRGLEQALIEQGKLLEALPASDGRRGRALFSTLRASCVAHNLPLPTNQEMTAADFTTLAKEQQSTLLVYSLALTQRSGSTSHIGLWLIPSAGEIEYRRLPTEELLAEIQDPRKHVFSSFPFYEQMQKQDSVTETSPPHEEHRSHADSGKDKPFSMRRIVQRAKQVRFSKADLDAFDEEKRALLAPLAEDQDDNHGKEGASDSVEKLTELLDEEREGTKAFVEALIRKEEASFQEKLRRWHQALIEPVLSHLPKEGTLTIVPDGYLEQLPFAAFRDSEGTYLIERYALNFIPSIHLVDFLRGKVSTSESNKALVLGNPTKDLEYAEQEAQAVANLLGTENVYMQSAATRQKLKEEASTARWLHFACHSKADVLPPHNRYSVFGGHLSLAGEEYIYSDEIAEMSLQAELVVLSSCESGRGTRKAAGSIGPIWSFLAAGARSVLATCWELTDGSLTVEMVKEFYQHILGEHPEHPGQSIGKTDALRRVLLMGLSQERERASEWACFFLSGIGN